MRSWSETVRTWGTTARERERPFPCDRWLPDQNEAYYRGVTVRAEPSTLFRWLCQLRVAPYSYDWIDNFGRQSPRQLTPGLEELERGQTFMAGFDLVDFERDVQITVRPRMQRWIPPMVVSYLVDPAGDSGCRLLVKLAIRYRPRLIDRLIRQPAPWLDWVMMRRQLLNLKALAEGTAQADTADRFQRDAGNLR